MDQLKRMAIFGIGKSGLAALKLAKKMNIDVFVINSGPVEKWFREELSLEQCFSEDQAPLNKISEIILSPGISLDHPLLQKAFDQKISVLSEIEFAYRYAKDIPVIAITGTNGKTTTVSMISKALELAGKKVFCGGNIGIPYSELPLSQEEFDWAVIEVSSFQLEAIKTFHPRIGAILNLSPNHTERYDDLESYAQAKFNLSLKMTSTDTLILGEENPMLHLMSNHLVKKIFFSRHSIPDDFLSRFDFSMMKVRGEHNLANFFVTYQVLLEALNTESKAREVLQTLISTFPGVPHRLEFVTEFEGKKIYNDAKSTNILSTIVALESFTNGDEKIILILGGKRRSLTNQDSLVSHLFPFKSKIEKIYAIGEAALGIQEELKDDFQVENLESLNKVYEELSKISFQGIVLFSPAYPSFDQFKNYVERGNFFKALFLAT